MDIEEDYEGKVVLVTGGVGCIGTNLCRKLANLGAGVIILDNLSSAYEWNLPRGGNIMFVNTHKLFFYKETFTKETRFDAMVVNGTGR
jgi:nucleoside-diphosphate-sugar epimerase